MLGIQVHRIVGVQPFGPAGTLGFLVVGNRMLQGFYVLVQGDQVRMQVGISFLEDCFPGFQFREFRLQIGHTFIPARCLFKCRYLVLEHEHVRMILGQGGSESGISAFERFEIRV